MTLAEAKALLAKKVSEMTEAEKKLLAQAIKLVSTAPLKRP
jgi:hypothetical protein